MDPKKLLKLKKTDYIVIFLIGILILIVMIPAGKKSSAKESMVDSQTDAAMQDDEGYEDYEKELESKLKEILEKIDGVGDVDVMITLSDDGTKALDKDIKESTEYTEENTVIYDSDDKTVPYVTSIKRPKVEGVLVVAQGGGNPQTDSDISCAVQALFDVAPHKIKIAKMLSREE